MEAQSFTFCRRFIKNQIIIYVNRGTLTKRKSITLDQPPFHLPIISNIQPIDDVYRLVYLFIPSVLARTRVASEMKDPRIYFPCNAYSYRVFGFLRDKWPNCWGSFAPESNEGPFPGDGKFFGGSLLKRNDSSKVAFCSKKNEMILLMPNGWNVKW